MKYYIVGDDTVNVNAKNIKKGLNPNHLVESLDVFPGEEGKEFSLFSQKDAATVANHYATGKDSDDQLAVFEVKIAGRPRMRKEKLELLDNDEEVVGEVDVFKAPANKVSVVNASFRHVNDKIKDIDVSKVDVSKLKKKQPSTESEASESEESEQVDSASVNEEEDTKKDNKKDIKGKNGKGKDKDASSDADSEEEVKNKDSKKSKKKKKSDDSEEATWMDTAKKYAIPGVVGIAAGAAFFAFAIPAVAPWLATKGLAMSSIWIQAGLSTVVAVAAGLLTEGVTRGVKAAYNYFTKTSEEDYNEAVEKTQEKVDELRAKLKYSTGTEIGDSIKDNIAKAPEPEFTKSGAIAKDSPKHDKREYLNYYDTKLTEANNLNAAANDGDDKKAKLQAKRQLGKLEQEIKKGPTFKTK